MDYKIENDRPTIYFFGRRKSLEQEVFTVPYEPYFYAPTFEVKQRGNPNAESELIPAIDGRKVSKIVTEYPRDVPIEAKKYSRVYEDKLPFPLRFLIDRGIKAGFTIENGKMVPASDIPELSMVKCYLDFEVETIDGIFPKEDEAPNLMLVGTVGWEDERLKTFTCCNEDEEQGFIRDVIKEIHTGSGHGYPDVILAWNVYFDLATFLNRSKKLMMDPGLISPMNYADIRESNRSINIQGINVFDLWPAFKKYFQSRTFPSYKLDDICAREEFLSWEKQDFDYLNKMNRRYIDDIVPYNRDDVLKLIKLDKMLHLTDMYDGIRRVSGCRLEDSLFTTMFADTAVLHEYHGIYILGTRMSGQKVHIQGAYVHLPKPGLHISVIILDFAGMYPGIIISNNISPECIVDESFTGPYIEIETLIDGKRGKVRYRTDVEGIIPKMIKKFMVLRGQAKAEMKKHKKGEVEYRVWDMIQYEYKQMIAAIFGVFQNENFRLFNPKIGASITSKGRKYIKQLIKFIEEDLGYPVLYSDTDSVFISTGGDGTFEHFKTEGVKAEGIVNEHLRDLAKEDGLTEPPVIEFEVGFKKFLLGTKKKRYAGRITYYKGREADEIMIKGFEARRSDAAAETQKLQIDVIDMILKEGTERQIRDRIMDSVDRIKVGEIEDVGIPKRLNQNLYEYVNIQQYRHFLWAQQHLDKHYVPGSRPYVFWMGNQFPEGLPGAMELEVMLKRKGTRKGAGKVPMRKTYKIDRVPLDTQEELDMWRPFIDWRTQAFKIVDMKLGTFLDAAGLTMSEVKSGQKQQRFEVYQ